VGAKTSVAESFIGSWVRTLRNGGHAAPFPQRRDQKTGNGSLNAAGASAYQQRAGRTEVSRQAHHQHHSICAHHHANVPRRPPGAANDRKPAANNPKAPPPRHNTGNFNLFAPSSFSLFFQLERERVAKQEYETQSSLDLSDEPTEQASRRDLSRGAQCNAMQLPRALPPRQGGPTRRGLRALPSLPTPVPRKHPSLPHWKWGGPFTSGRRQKSLRPLALVHRTRGRTTGRAYRRSLALARSLAPDG
jgi:hypothetical protein